MTQPPSTREPLGSARRRGLTRALSAFVAFTAFAGAAELLWFRQGSPYVPISLLDHAAFASFTIPALLLLVVVAGSALSCTICVQRRARASIDTTLLAGGALLGWIVAEVAQLRELSWLQGLYAALGLALLGLAVAATWRHGSARQRWVLRVSVGETLGFMAPAVVGTLCTRWGLSDGLLATAVIAAGAMEGLCLGIAQASAWPLRPNLARYGVATALSAALTWAVALALVALIHGDSAPTWAKLALAAVGVPLALLAMPAAQWLALPRARRGAWTWIGFNVLAWLLGLPATFLVGPLMDEHTPVLSQLALWLVAGALMAHLVAHVSWLGVRAVVRRAKGDPAQPDDYTASPRERWRDDAGAGDEHAGSVGAAHARVVVLSA